MSLPGVSVRRPIGVVMIYLAVIVLGLVALARLPVDLMPRADMPRMNVTTTYTGVAPQEIETLITRPVEQALSSISGVEKIEATSSEGLSRVSLEFEWGTDLDVAVADVRAQLDRLVTRLPEDADPPMVYKFDLSSFPVAQLGISGGGDPRSLRYLAEETLARRIERLPGVASVNVRGGRVREVQVRLHGDRLSALGLAPDTVIQALRAENRNVSGGDLLDDGREVVVRTLGEFEEIEQIERVVVAVRDGRPIYVADVADVADSHQELRSELWIDSVPGIQMRVSKRDNANTVQVVDALRKEVERINADYEGVARITFVSDSSTFIRQAIDNVTSAAVGGAILAILVLLAFLRDLRSTLVVALSIPVSILATFALMDGFGISLNTVSFGGLALGIGMLVDNAIVLVENVFRLREEGAAPEDAAIRGSDQVALAITASTITTMAVFVPVNFIEGFAGVFFREMAIVVSFALTCSLAVALTLVPALAARLLALPTRRTEPSRLAQAVARPLEALDGAYSRAVQRALLRPWRVLAGSVGLLFGAVLLGQLVSFELMPETDEGRINVNLELPIGTPLETTMQVMKRVESRIIEAVPPDELGTVMTYSGPENWWRPGGSHQGSMEIVLVPRSERSRGIEAVEADVRAAIGDVPGARVQIRRGTSNFLVRMMRGGGSDRLAVMIRGHDLEVATALGQQVEQGIRGIDGITFVRADREEPRIERQIRIDRDRIAELGLRGPDVAHSVETYLLGTVASQYRDAGGEYDIRVRLREEEGSRLDQLVALPVVTPDGRVVPISQVALIEEGLGPSSISRENQERVLRINVGVAGRPLGDIAAEINEVLRGLAVPDDFTVDVSGEYEQQQRTFGGLYVGLALAIFLVYTVMAVQFESVRDPLVIMAAVPFAFIGAILALVLTGTTFNLYSFLGTIVLVGVVVNNAIVLVDAANQLRRDEGLALVDAIVTAARRRLRPILMTTLTSCLGMLPLAMGWGEGSELQAPLARVVIGGLAFSTVVTLFLVPCLYLLAWRRQEEAARSGGLAVAG